MKGAGPFAAILLGFAALVEGSLPSGYGALFLSPHASSGVRTSAEDLAMLLERGFGERPSIRREPLGGLAHGIHIGPRPGHPSFDDNPLTDEILVERTGRGIEIRGSDNSSTAFAVYRFAEELLGWRLYQPGEAGLEKLDSSPEPPSSHGMQEILLQERAGYYSRNPHPSAGRAGNALDWAKWHGVRERFVYNHSLHAVVTPELFEDHPGWFAKDASGQPMRPPFPGPHGYNDHPDLANQQVREWVAGKTVHALEMAAESPQAYWRKQGYPPVRFAPGMVSTSLSLGDSFIFGHHGSDYPWNPAEYFRRWPDWSNHVFDYTNALARDIIEAWGEMPEQNGDRPQLYLGALSYLNWEDTPDFEVHPAIVPYMTFDRSQWFDPAARADDLALVEKWAAKGTEILGTWDYLFGYGFLMPRSLQEVVSESIPALFERGVRAYFCQVAPLWPYDAHTTWLATRLLWNPSADPEALMGEFFSEFYGPAAGPMRDFFDLSESVWMNQPGRGWWLKYWKDPWQAALWNTQQLDLLQAFLDAAMDQAVAVEDSAQEDGLAASRFTTRVRQTRELFQATRLFVEYESAAWALNEACREISGPGQLEEPLAMAEHALDTRAELVERVRGIVRDNPLAARASDLEWILLYDNTGGCLGFLGLEASRTGDPDARREADRLVRKWQRMEGRNGLPGYEKAHSILYDTSFGHAEDPQIWHRQHLDSDGLEMESLQPPNGFRVKAVRRGNIFQLFRVQPGHFYLGDLGLEASLADSGEIFIRLDFFSESHELLAQSRQARMPPGGKSGHGQQIRVLMQAPPESAYGRIFIRFYEMEPDNEARLRSVDVLDLGGHRIP
jgi:hypothetical protein